MAKKEKQYLYLPLSIEDGGMCKLEVDFTKGRKFAVHRPIGSKKDYVVTHVESLKCVLRVRLKTEAMAAAKALEFLADRVSDLCIRRIIEELRDDV